MNGVQSHLHVPTHASIYLDMLLLQIQTFTWQVNCKPTLQQLCSVILLQIIHLQLYVEFPFVEIHCKIITMLHSSKVSLFHTLVVFSHSYSYLPKSYRVIPCEMDQISEKFPPDPHGFCWHFSSQCTHQEMKILKILLSSHERFQNYSHLNCGSFGLKIELLQFMAFWKCPYLESFHSKHLKFWNYLQVFFLEVFTTKNLFS